MADPWEKVADSFISATEEVRGRPFLHDFQQRRQPAPQPKPQPSDRERALEVTRQNILRQDRPPGIVEFGLGKVEEGLKFAGERVAAKLWAIASGSAFTEPVKALQGETTKDELERYHATDLPWGIKGALESLPYMAIPGGAQTRTALLNQATQLTIKGDRASLAAAEILKAASAGLGPLAATEEATGAVVGAGVRGAVRGTAATARGAAGLARRGVAEARLAPEAGFVRLPGGAADPGKSGIPAVLEDLKKAETALAAAIKSRGAGRGARIAAAQEDIQGLRSLHLNTLQAELPEAEFARYMGLQEELVGATGVLRAIVETRPPAAPRFGARERAEWEAARKEAGVSAGATGRRKEQLRSQIERLEKDIKAVEEGRTLPEGVSQPSGVGGQAGFGIGERPQQGQLLGEFRGEAVPGPGLVDVEGMQAQAARRAQIAAGQGELPTPPTVAGQVTPPPAPATRVAAEERLYPVARQAEKGPIAIGDRISANRGTRFSGIVVREGVDARDRPSFIVRSWNGVEHPIPKDWAVRVETGTPSTAPAARVDAGAAEGVTPSVEPPVARAKAETESVAMLSKERSTQLSTTNVTDDFARASDPSGAGAPPPPPRSPTARGGAGRTPPTPEDTFARIARQATRGETPNQTLIRRHEAAITTAENEARTLVDQGNRGLRRQNIGQTQRGRLVPRQEDIPVMDELFEALHNPSKVASGEVPIPQGFRAIYGRLRQLTDWEEAMRIDFDPDMATVQDYFYRGWIAPKAPPTPTLRGGLGYQAPFKKPRVDATYREMRGAGFEPISWNPYEQWRISRLQGVRYRQQMQLIEDMKRLDGEPVAMYSRRWVVPEDLANRLESIYGVPLNLGKVNVGNRSIDLLKAIDAVVFIPKRFKLFGSLFQQMDFLTRSGVGAWTGAVDALAAGQPINAVKRLAVWPKSAVQIIEANFRPGAREAIRKQLNSTTPLIPSRPGIHLRGIMEGGLSTIDTTILPTNIDDIAREAAQEAGLLANKAVRRAIGSLESVMRRGLFEGTYPAAQITDIKNNIAPIIVRRYGNLSDEAINGMIAQVTNKKYSTIPAGQSAIQNRSLREILRRVFFSMGESEGLLRQATGAIRGPEAGYWRTHWIGAYLALIGAASAIHFATTGEPLPADRWSPISKDTWGPLPIGYNQKFAAPDIPVKGKEGLNITLDLVGQLDTAFRILDPPGFLSSRESVPIRALTTQVTERDYFGRPIDTVGPGGIYSRTANLINDMFSPIGVGQAAIQIGLQQGRIPEGLIPASERGLGTAGQLIQATGLNLRAQYLRNLWEGDLQAFKDIPTKPVERGYGTEFPYSRTEYRNLNPEVDAKLFIVGDVTSLRTYTAMMVALRLMQENGIKPDDIKAIADRRESRAEYQEAGKYLEPTLVDSLTNLLDQGYKPQQQPTPTSTPQATPSAGRWQGVRPLLDTQLLEKLHKLWQGPKGPLKPGDLNPIEERRLRFIYEQFPYGQSSFSGWVKETLRQAQFNSVNR
jgi:hypothetical protein